MTRSAVGLALLAVVVLASSSCSSWPTGLVSTSSPKPDMAALAGHWRPIEKGSPQQPQPSGRQPMIRGRLILTPDGQAIFDDLPDFQSTANGAPPSSLSGPGSWSIVEDAERGAWALSITTSVGTREYFVSGTAPTYELLAIVGDPDDRKVATLAQIR